ncbi:hypothetical protein Q3H58_000696 [Pseudomonas psychrotolerans]|nr:hypothetical protein [Pseudomonas psychrotolerans]
MLSRRHHGGEHETHLAVLQYRDPYRKGQQPAGACGQLPDHRPALGDHLGEARRFGQGPSRCLALGGDPLHDLPIGGGEQDRQPARHQRQDPPDQGGEVVQVAGQQQGGLGERLQDGHGAVQFAFDGGGRLAAGLQRTLFGFVLLVLYQ